MMKCKFCGNTIEAGKTRPRVFCSDACRKASKRTKITDREVKITDKKREITDKPAKITDTDNEITDTNKDNGHKKRIAVEGICHGCGEEVNPLICICLSCITAGKRHETLNISCPDYDLKGVRVQN